MDQQGADTSLLGDGERAQDRIFQQALAESTALHANIHRQATEYHHRHRVRHVTTDRTMRVGVVDGPGREGIVAKHLAMRVADDKRP